jgi:hypothetical protein
MANVFTALSDVLLPRCYGQVVAALVARAVVLLVLMVLGGCASLPAMQRSADGTASSLIR